ncbi:MAG TPA: mechanosensitive ion channel family protein [Candidatus Krumholzibacteria bacterium]|nr:mechanosensitive ion channel family protein [Candidatus Krumholzibacteria bacterium]HRX52066.1 mechanosensitive ion channel family protein [Candidatus Krumholzibacteria bacterium]
MTILDRIVLDNSVSAWLMALGIAVGVSVGLRLVLKLAVSRLRIVARRTRNHVDDSLLEALAGTRGFTLLAVGVVIAAGRLELSAAARAALGSALTLILLLQGGLWAAHALSDWLRVYRERQLEADRGAATAVGAARFLGLTAVWSMVLVLVLGNLGVNVTALVTGLGVGGIAVALALQNVFSDLFASLSIVFDKPFVIGDFVITGDLMGVVENVGLKTTRIRSLSGEQLVFANSDLLKSRIRNYGRMRERRVVLSHGVTYGTSQENLEAAPRLIREAVTAEDHCRFDRSNFHTYGDSALLLETVYYVDEPDYNLHMDVQERIQLRIREAFADAGIEFAFPTRTLHLHRDAVPEARREEARA